MPNIPRLPTSEAVAQYKEGIVNDLREQAKVNRLYLRPSADVNKICSRQGVITDRRRGNPPYDAETYVAMGRVL